MPANHEITQLLQAWSDGDDDALDALIPLVFDDLHRMAHYFFQRESENHTLQATALVSELYLRLRGQKQTHWDSRKDFFNFAADVMRHILVDWARRRKSKKRGRELVRVPLDPSIGLTMETDVDVIALHTALGELAELDERQSDIVKLRFFLGLTVAKTAVVLDIAPATVKREWRTAKFWLHRRLKDSRTPGEDT